jgi:glycosyltransferase involved in cell wall biosynthesis
MNHASGAFDRFARAGSRPAPLCSVIVPASNEAAYIGDSLGALLASDLGDHARIPVEIVVVANGCGDDTAAVASGFAAAAAARGWRLAVLEVAEAGKLNALNIGDAAATGDIRIYLDADVHVSPRLVAELVAALDRPEPAYASGRPTAAAATSWVTRAYTRVWRRVPFMSEGVPGCCVFAVNAAGRGRWGAFPAIVADDTFVRLQFAPYERIGVAAPYAFPMPEGFARLLRLRRRQDYGAREVARLYPELARNDDKPPFGLGRALAIVASDPAGFAVYCVVALAARVRARRYAGVWLRARAPSKGAA